MYNCPVSVEATWQEIRALRAAPTGTAANDPDRRATFVAALRQAQELATAATAADYAAMPLPLFYSLSQAGRAIAAAHLQGPWKLQFHGLNVTDPPNAGLLETRIKPATKTKRVDSFSGVATAINSPPLNGSTQLGALWAANPDLRDVPIPTSAGSWPHALEFKIGPVTDPDGRPPEEAVPTGGIFGVSVVDLPARTGADVSNVTQSYPSLRGSFGMKNSHGRTEQAGPLDTVTHSTDNDGRVRVNIGKSAPAQTTRAERQKHLREFASYIEKDPESPYGPIDGLIGYALPEIGGDACPFPLMLWWALLLGLSSLARYHPAEWSAAIDVDYSDLAVSLEKVLDVAKERVPERILQSLNP